MADYTNNETVTRLLTNARNRAALIADLQAEQARDLEALATAAVACGKHTVTNVGTFTVSENNTYDKDAMVALLSPGQVKRCQKAALDGQVVKRLYPDVYAATKRARGFKVSIG